MTTFVEAIDMSAGLRGPPLVRVSATSILGTEQESRNSIHLSQHQNSPLSQPSTPRDVHHDDQILSQGLGTISINNISENDIASALSFHHNVPTFSVPETISGSGGIIGGTSSSFSKMKGPPPPPEIRNSPRYSTDISPSINCPPPQMKNVGVSDNLLPTNQFQKQYNINTAQYRSVTPPPPPHRVSSSSPTSPPKHHVPPSSNFRSGIQPPQPSPKNKARIDSSQMPRPPRPQRDIVFNTRAGVGRKVPPLSGSTFKSVDKGNCSPRLMRVTMCAIPSSKEILNSTGIPFAIVSTPFAGPENLEEPVPIVDMGASPPRYENMFTFFFR